jgi:hypothetical protein
MYEYEGARGGAVGWGTSRQVAGSLPDGVIGIFHWYNPGVHSATIRNEYQEYFLEGKVGLHVPIVLKSGRLSFLEPSGPVQGLLYLYLCASMMQLGLSLIRRFNKYEIMQMRLAGGTFRRRVSTPQYASALDFRESRRHIRLRPFYVFRFLSCRFSIMSAREVDATFILLLSFGLWHRVTLAGGSQLLVRT